MNKDQRHFLYKYYLEILQNLKPDLFVYENVPGLFSAKANGQRIFLKLLKDFANLTPAYDVMPPLDDVEENPSSYILNSADFGVPQSRKRLIIIGYKKSLARQNPEIKNIFANLKYYCKNHRKIQGFLTADDAIGDLPRLKHGEGNNRFYSNYNRLTDLKKYQIKMRKGSSGILNHNARKHMNSDLERYRFFIEHHKNGNKAATLNDLRAERPDLIPNHKHLDKFVDRFKVQWWNRPSSTIMSHISKDGHYYIHPDIHQCRSFTVREAARCQSFPDNFFFEGPRTSQFMQVGNAVPPLMAQVIAKYIRNELNKIYS
jgi:DNA (cytosine-5)-methyltransferase 1